MPPKTGYKGDLEDRFWQKVKRTSSCWVWTGSKTKDGYGQIKIDNKVYGAHRIAYELYKNEIPDHLQVCHHCDNPSCVNPSHLFLGTALHNKWDSILKGRHKNIIQHNATC